MDLTADQSTRIKKFIQDWANDPRMELETTFGVGGVVDSTTFLQIAQRLRAKGFKPNAQEDRLNIITPSHMRFTLEGLGILQSYCKDDTLTNKTFTVMIKDRAAPNSNIDIDEYDVRFKMRREEELGRDHPRVVETLKKWQRERKAYRLIRRWSFEGKGVRMDLSMVRQTVAVTSEPAEDQKGKSKPRTNFDWSTSFLEKNILQQLPRYEVEVELLRDEFTSTPELALKALISGVGEVLRAIQKNSLLLRKSIATSIRNEYHELVQGPKFRGVGPITLETKHMTREIDESTVNVRSGFNVTDKADGLRTMGYVSSTGELYLVDQSLNIYRTGLQNEKCRNSLVDGEWVTLTKSQEPINHFLLFDIYYAAEGESVSQLPFATFKDDARDIEGKSRYNSLKEWFSVWNTDLKVVAKGVTPANRLVIAIKEFHFAPPGETIFTSGCSLVLDTPRIYHTDGLILTSNSAPIPDALGVRFDQQFKWKPARENTVDFLVSFDKDPEFMSLDHIQTTEHPVTHEIIQYKTMRLYVGGKKSKEEANPRQTILQQLPFIDENQKRSQYRPILFHPTDYPNTMANTCYIQVTTDPETYEDYALTEDSKEPIRHNSIVEMRYDPRREPGWRWIPSRIRHDKTERLQRAIVAAKAKDGEIKYSGMMNDENVANSVWNSIHDPITESMIRTGREEPTEDELKEMMSPSIQPEDEAKSDLIGAKYYERKAPKENMALIKGLQDFHNKYIKNEILLKRSLLGFNRSIVDLACGKAGDLYKWITNHAGRVVGIDTASDNITNPMDGAYRRYMDFLREGRSRKPPKIAFVIGNSSKSIIDGSAGATPEERDILRSIFGRAEPEGPVPPYIQNEMAGSFRGGADVAACMFALHYFFESKSTLDGFIENVGNAVKIGGYFIGCCFDGQKVFQLLQGISRGETRTGSENDVPIWSITKEYEADNLTDDDESIGLGIEVNFISIGMTHKEYIVPFELLKKKLSRVGFRLLNTQELAELNLESSTNTFDRSYEMSQEISDPKLQKKFKFFMPNAVKDFSFLNRWFIFKRQGITQEEIASAPASSAAIPADAMNQRFDIGITKYNKSYARFSIVSSSPYSVLKPWEKKYVNDAFKKWFPARHAIRHIVDATAHIGVDTINMSNQFPNAVVDAFEVVPETYEALVKNIIKFEKQNFIRAHNQDITTWEPTTMVDFLYVDPPWGGKNYDKEDSIDLFLQKEDNVHNESKNVNFLIDQWIESKQIKAIVLKAPKNFNKSYLSAKYKVEEEKVLNRVKEIAYTLLYIRAPEVRADAVVEEAPVVEEKEAEEKNDRDLFTILRDPTKTFKEKDLFIFGPNVALRDSLKAKGRPALSLSFGPEHAGRWLSLSTPFPIPDRDLKGKDGQPILYPTMEHYMAAMKYQHASNHPELVIPLFSTMGNTIHQKFITKRREKRVVYGSLTPDDYKLMEEEIKEVKQKMTKEFTEKQRVVFDDAKWNRPIRSDDPLSLRDRILYDAFMYRWEKDDNFRKIIEEAREQHRYLLYNVGPESEKSEWAAKLEIAGPSKGRITGENRIGFMLMEIAKFDW